MKKVLKFKYTIIVELNQPLGEDYWFLPFSYQRNSFTLYANTKKECNKFQSKINHLIKNITIIENK